jgi:hypothetical protein
MVPGIGRQDGRVFANLAILSITVVQLHRAPLQLKEVHAMTEKTIKYQYKPLSEVVFINNLKLTNVFNANWVIKHKKNMIRHLIGKINSIPTPFKITVRIDRVEEDNGQLQLDDGGSA